MNVKYEKSVPVYGKYDVVVLGGGLAELALTAWITVSKVKKGGNE